MSGRQLIALPSRQRNSRVHAHGTIERGYCGPLISGLGRRLALAGVVAYGKVR